MNGSQTRDKASCLRVGTILYYGFLKPCFIISDFFFLPDRRVRVILWQSMFHTLPLFIQYVSRQGVDES